MALVTTQQALAHLRADSSEDISIYLAAAEEAAIAFLNRQVYESSEALEAAVLAGTAGDDPIVVTGAVKAAILLILGHLYRNREDVLAEQSATAIELPMGSRALLQPFRIWVGV
ncbi:hypothetical protein CAL26_09235 [Bordetella genomosp. 9]|uniref:Phage gp6-like head-tail connector protein n=1 Tax=Bordetella genomosp. 9 TaxID=1416803 RepID=A0A261RF14_9BORD|nr:head-tail connector protein [Bordetella genomosp. 9]OZI23614.1 hypothetical protein CAL26_09235 [Bordetella genomosp. 9]